MRGIIFRTAKEAFRRGYKKYKQGKRKTERVPYDLVKKDIKRSIRSTKFYSGTDAKKLPKTKSLPKGGPRPSIFGKAYASDKAAKKTMMIPMMTKKQREANQEAISQSVRKFMKEKIGRKAQGGVMVNKMLAGGLLTKAIRYGYKAYRKAGGKPTFKIVKDSGVSRSTAKADVKSSISNKLKSKRNFAMIKIEQNKNPKTIADIDKLKKYRQDKKELTRSINRFK